LQCADALVRWGDFPFLFFFFATVQDAFSNQVSHPANQSLHLPKISTQDPHHLPQQTTTNFQFLAIKLYLTLKITESSILINKSAEERGLRGPGKGTAPEKRRQTRR
jgi:hypothetical protein